MSLLMFSSCPDSALQSGTGGFGSKVNPNIIVLCLLFPLVGLGMLCGCNGSTHPLISRAVPVRPVRVKLLEDIKLMDVKVLGAYVITDESNRILQQSSSPALLKVRHGNGGILVNGQLLAGKSLCIKPTSFANIELSGRRYHGYLRVVISRHGSMLAINHVPLGDYVASVVGGELPGYFRTEAFRAQAVAARTYVLHRMLHNNRPDWDVSAGPASQVYGGLKNETRKTRRAQRSTRGEVLVWSNRGQDEIICTFYSSTCGGGTQAAWDVKEGFDRIEPLGGVKIDLCQKSTRYTWKKKVWKKDDLRETVLAKLGRSNAELKRLGQLKTVRVSSWTSGHRAKQISLTDKRGRKVTISADQLRLALQLPSTWFRIVDRSNEVWFTEGRGWGHGMGMCQYGANRMAELGYDYEKILTTYYPGAKLVRFY